MLHIPNLPVKRWSYNQWWPWNEYFYSDVVIWDGSTRVLWQQAPSEKRMRIEIPTLIFIDTAPKIGRAFGFIAPKMYFQALVQQYYTYPTPKAFLEAVNAQFLANAYELSFKMAAMEVFHPVAIISRIYVNTYKGKVWDQSNYNPTGMIIMDLKQERLSDSFGQS